MKKIFIVIVALLVLLNCFFLPLSLKADTPIIVKLWINSQYMEVNGLRQPIDAEGTKPIIIESRTLVPIRAIIEAFGGTVTWSPSDKKVTIVLANNTVELTINKPTAYLNGFAIPIDSNNSKVVPQIINGRTMVPLRFVAESLGILVDYNASNKQITLTYYIKKNIPSIPQLLSPINGSSITDKTVTFSWTKVQDAEYYKFSIYSNNSIVYSKDNVIDTQINIDTSLLGAGSFTWNVCACNSSGCSDVSSSYNFSIVLNIAVPDTPTPISPAQGMLFETTNITFSWTSVSNVESYKLIISQGNNIIYTKDSILTNQYTLSGTEITQNGDYTWQVLAHNSVGDSPLSSPINFTFKKLLTTSDIAQLVDRVVYIEAESYEGTGIGSGFIISSDGVVVTNYHVIDGATSGTVTFSNGVKCSIDYVLGYAKPKNFGDKDFAVLKINATNLPTVTIGDSDKVKAGDKVVAIGNPLGIQNVVSEGIISKVWSPSEQPYPGLIQITAPISPGNSGGPLFNMYGEVIGVNTFQYVDGQNLNFALPSNWLKSVDTSLKMTLKDVYQKEKSGTQQDNKVPILLSPEEGEPITFSSGRTIIFKWSNVAGVNQYYLWIGRGLSGDDSSKVFGQQLSVTQYTLNTSFLTAGQIYTWAVAIKDAKGDTIWSKDGHFSIVSTGLPQIISPINNGRCSGSFSWSSIPPLSSNEFYAVLVTDGNDQTIYYDLILDNSVTIDPSYFVSGQKYTFMLSIVYVDKNFGSFILYFNYANFYFNG